MFFFQLLFVLLNIPKIRGLYFVNEGSIFLKNNITNFRNNRILVDADNQFDLNEFYQSILSVADQFDECNCNDKEIQYIRTIIDSQLKNHKANNTLPKLNNINKKTRKTINEIQKELEEVKKELDSKRDSEIGIQPIHDKVTIIKDENSYVSEQEDFKKLENSENILKTEDGKIIDNKLDDKDNKLDDKDNKLDDKDNKTTSINNYKEPKVKRRFKKIIKKLFKIMMTSSTFLAIILSSGLIIPFMLLITRGLFDGIKKWWKVYELNIKKSKKL
ncbi:hypothetical protein YYC_00216 [Plasmodium yoelii 17X]|nr:hypothetical protein YYC_00216 [Plasmodium yoelii 17X]